MRSGLLIAAISAVSFSTSSPGQETVTGGAEPPTVLRSVISPGATLDQLSAQVGPVFRSLDANGDGRLNREDAALHETLAAAMQRTSSLMPLLSADLNGDGAVTEQELRQRRRYEQRAIGPASPQRSEAEEKEIARLMEADTDKDGRISLEEALALGSKAANARERLSQGFPKGVRDLLAFAGPERESLTLSDIQEQAARLFRLADRDGNGTISQDEFASLQQRDAEVRRREAEAKRLAQAAEARAGCTMPRASEQAKVLLLSAYEADALSTTAIGSQDVGTGTGEIAVGPGTDPIYVVISAHRPVIWRFTGAVDRLERVVLGASMTGPNSSRAGTAPLAGATGVPADRITFLPRPNCLTYFTEAPSSKAAMAAAVVRNEAGKDPVVSGRYGVAGFALPSGEIRTSGRADRPMLVISKPAGSLRIEGGANVVVEAGASDLASEVARFYPGGLVEVDPSKVVASAPPVRYDTLPNQAGLLQLLQRGAITKNRSGEFIIKQKIRFPAELYGGHSARFLVLRGVPEPEGDPGHSCVILEETGAPFRGADATCR